MTEHPGRMRKRRRFVALSADTGDRWPGSRFLRASNMNSKSVEAAGDKAEPGVVRVIVSAPLSMKVSGAKPEARLYVDSVGQFVTSYHAWGREHVMRFSDLDTARTYFDGITDYLAPNRSRRSRPAPARVGRPAA
jgi:hypothetical protein